MMLVQSVVNSFGSEVLGRHYLPAAMRDRIHVLCCPDNGIGNALHLLPLPHRISVRTGKIASPKVILRIKKLYGDRMRRPYLHEVLELFQIVGQSLRYSSLLERLWPPHFATGEQLSGLYGLVFCLIGFKMAVDGLLLRCR